MVAKVGGVFGTLTYPHLIRPYSGYYGHLASHYGGPWCPPIPCLCNKTHLQVLEPPIYEKMVGLPVLSVLTTGGSPNKFVWGLPAGTEDPQIQVLDNMPRYCC